jgi:carbon storage regulator
MIGIAQPRPQRKPSEKEPRMLILSRRVRESVVIDNKIVVTVVKIRGNQVQLAFEAPREMPIHRREIHEAILREELDACELELDTVA